MIHQFISTIQYFSQQQHKFSFGWWHRANRKFVYTKL